LGKVNICSEVASELIVLRTLLVPAKPMLPLLYIVNLVAPDFEAVKRSPEPELSTISPALVVVPAMEATGEVASVPVTSRVACGSDVPTPSLLFVESKYRLESETMFCAPLKKAIWVAVPVPVMPDPAPAQLPEARQTSISVPYVPWS